MTTSFLPPLQLYKLNVNSAKHTPCIHPYVRLLHKHTILMQNSQAYIIRYVTREQQAEPHRYSFRHRSPL